MRLMHQSIASRIGHSLGKIVPFLRIQQCYANEDNAPIGDAAVQSIDFKQVLLPIYTRNGWIKV